jgi:serine/threonine-protein kinase
MGSALTTAAPRLIGRYLVFGEIASGGMATVHFGRMTGSVGFARTVAVKRLHPQFAKDPEFVTMFLDEARVAGRIRHPNVVPTLDVVATEGEIFLAMEYVQGESLSKLLKMARAKGRPPPPQVVATIIANLLHGLHAAHEAKDEHGQPLGIVHRDVSPQNVLVGADGVARVLDFGVAKAAGRLQTTREGQVKGKLSYMSPEQLNGGGVSRLADIYASAVVLWETLTQERLFDGDNEAMTLVKVLDGRVDPPSHYVPNLPPGTDEVVMRGLARDPSVRFQTARDMAVAIERTMGLASPAIVGEWVESVAADELAARAAHVAQIEQASVASSPESVARLLPSPPSGAAVVRAREEPSSQVSSISVSRNAHRTSFPSEAPGIPRAVIAAICVIVTLGAAASVFVFATQRKASARVAQSAVIQTQLGVRALEIADHGVNMQGVTSALGAAASNGVVGSPAAPVPPPPAQPKSFPTPPPKQTAKPPPPKGTDCNPPYTIDPATGHKRYKKNCD